MKKVIVFLILVVSLLCASSVFAVSVQLNGEIINFTDEKGNVVEAQIINDRTMVPLRKIFESLNCTVDWDGNTQTVTATNGNTQIVLQINNIVATKTENGVTEKLKLDSVPIIKNERTLVPLRFIAESLGKQVAWDANNQMAIIIDYTYFKNKLKNEVPALYYFLLNDYGDSKVTNGTIERKYVDNDNIAKNNNANIYFEISETKRQNIEQNLKLNFSGNNSLMQDIIQEKWNNAVANIIYKNDEISYTSTGVFANVLENGKSNCKDLNLMGNSELDLEQAFRVWADISEEEIDSKTFKKMKEEFYKLCELFNYSSFAEDTEDGKKYTLNFNCKSLNYANAKMEYFDLTKLDNMIFNNIYSRAYSLVNKKIFNYDLNQDDIFYDTDNISLSGNIFVKIVNGKLINNEVNIAYKATNLYNEIWEYNVKINN